MGAIVALAGQLTTVGAVVSTTLTVRVTGVAALPDASNQPEPACDQSDNGNARFVALRTSNGQPGYPRLAFKTSDPPSARTSWISGGSGCSSEALRAPQNFRGCGARGRRWRSIGACWAWPRSVMKKPSDFPVAAIVCALAGLSLLDRT